MERHNLYLLLLLCLQPLLIWRVCYSVCEWLLRQFVFIFMVLLEE